MKVGFISPKLGGVMRPGLTYLSAYLKANGYSVAYLDSAESDEAEAFVAREKPDVLAYSLTSGEYGLYNGINRKLKQKYGLTSLVGGPHATFFAHQFMADQNNSFDAACRGEGEIAMLELLERLESGRDYNDVANWVVPDGSGGVRVNGLRPLIADLDTLPFPDFAMDPQLGSQKKARLWLHRGCPFNCTYCMNHVWRKLYKGLGKAVRNPGPDRCIEILKYRLSLTPGKIEHVLFTDDTFGHSIDWLKRFGRRYREEIGLPFTVQLYPGMITADRVEELARAGCKVVSTAIETGDEKRRRELLKRPMKDEAVIQGAKLVHRAGMGLKIQNILLLPGETLSSAWKTFDLNAKCRPEVATTGKFQPYPGVELTEKAIEMGHLKRGGFEDRIPDNFHWLSILEFSDHAMVNQVHNLVNLFTFGTYFTFMRPVVKLLSKMSNNKLHHHIDNMTWKVVTHRPDDEVRPSGVVKARVFLRFLAEFIRPANIRNTLKREISPVMNLNQLKKAKTDGTSTAGIKLSDV